MHTPLYIVLTIFITFCAATVQAAEFTALTAPYPPFSVSKGLTVSGPSIAALTAIMEQCGTPMDDQSFKLTPWAYAYRSAARKPRHIIVNARRSPDNERFYKWVGPILTSRIVLIGRKKDGPELTSRSDIRNYRIATVRWSRPEKALLAGGFERGDLLRTPTHVSSLRMLDRGEVDLFATNDHGARCQLEGLGMDPSQYTVCLVFDEEPLYYAFSRDTDDRLITRLNEALREYRSRDAVAPNLFSATDTP